MAVISDAVPLRTGVHEDLIAMLGEQFDPKVLGRFLAWHTRQPRYLRALADGAPRRNLDGTEASMPSDRENAAKALAGIEKKRAAKARVTQ